MLLLLQSTKLLVRITQREFTAKISLIAFYLLSNCKFWLPPSSHTPATSSTLATCCSHLCVKLCALHAQFLLFVVLHVLRSSFFVLHSLCLHSLAASLTMFAVVVSVIVVIVSAFAALFATCLLLCFCYCATHSEEEFVEDEGRSCCRPFSFCRCSSL